MDPKSRIGFQQLLEAQIAEWEKTIENLEHRLARAKDASDLPARIETMKRHLPVLREKIDKTTTEPDASWPRFKSEVDRILEDLRWLQRDFMRRLGGA